MVFYLYNNNPKTLWQARAQFALSGSCFSIIPFPLCVFPSIKAAIKPKITKSGNKNNQQHKLCAQSVSEQLLANQIINKPTQIQIFMSISICKINLVLKPSLHKFSNFNKDRTHKILKLLIAFTELISDITLRISKAQFALLKSKKPHPFPTLCLKINLNNSTIKTLRSRAAGCHRILHKPPEMINDCCMIRAAQHRGMT